MEPTWVRAFVGGMGQILAWVACAHKILASVKKNGVDGTG